MRRLLAAFLVLLSVSPASAGTIWITGFEHGYPPPTGNIGETDVMIYGLGAIAQQTTVRSGGWALNAATNNATRIFLDPLGPNTPTISCRLYVMFSVTPSPGPTIFFGNSVGTTLFAVIWTGTNMRITNSGAGFGNVTGTAVVGSGVWTRIDIAYDSAAGGVGKVWVNGTLDISTTHTGAQTNPTRFSLSGEGSTGGYFFDDVYCQSELTQPPDGKVIARRGIAGSPIDTGFTLSACASINACWSETPWSAAQSANSGATQLAVAQTMIVAPVTTTQAGFGTTVIPANATINAVQLQAIAKTSSTSSGGATASFRRYVNGVGPTDTAVTIVAITDRGYGSPFFTDTIPHLDLYQIGWVKAVSTANRTQTVEDMWLMVDFSAPVRVPLKVTQ